ncbi:Ncapd2, partial [Symbiodinium sp. KB8]
MEFITPVHLEDLELDKPGRLSVTDVLDAAAVGNTDGMLPLLEGAEFALEVQSDCMVISEERVFDAVYGVLRHWESAHATVHHAAGCVLSEALTGLLAMLSEDTLEVDSAQAKLAFKAAVYLRVEFAAAAQRSYTAEVARVAAKKGSSRGKLIVPSAKAGFDWAATRISVYTQLVQASLANFSHLWSAGVVEEAWAGLFPRAAAAALDDATATRDKALRPLLALLPCIAATRCPAVASSAAVGIMTRLQVLEHAPGHFAAALGEGLAGTQAADVAEALHLPPEAAHALRPLAPRLADFLRELLGELGRLGDGASDSASMRNLGAFLAELASAAPTALLPHVSSLHRHLDSPAYALRNAVVTALATLLAECFHPDAGSAAGAGEQGASAPPSVSVRDTLLDILTTRVMDKHALARAAALRAWASVVAAGALPMARCGDVAALAADRLRDTSSITRRAALALLCACMEHNPFAGTLVRRPFLAFAREAGAWLATHTTGDTRLGVFKVLQGVLGAEEARQEQAEAEAEAGEAAASSEQDSEHPDTAAQLQRLQYAACGGRLLDALDVAMPRVAELLTSETSSDVIAAVRALCVARAFGVGGSHSGLQAALNLVWSSEPTVVAAVTATFAHLYLTEPAEAAKARGEEGGHALGSRRSQVVADEEDEGGDEGEDGGGKGKAGAGSSLKRKGGVLVGVDGSSRLPCLPATAAANLIALAAGATAAVAASLEQLLRVLAGRGEVSSDVTDALWDCVGRGAVALGEGAGPTDPPVVGARTAMSILHMLTPVMPAIVNSETGLTRLRFVLKRPRDGATFDYHLAREAAAAAAAGMCTVLGGAPGTPAAIAAAESVDVARGAARSAAVQSLLGSLVALVVGGWDGGIVDDPAWFGAAGAALDAVFTLSPRPEAVVGSLLHTMLLTAFPPAPTEDDAEGEAAPATATAAIGQDARTWSGDALASAAAEGAVPAPLLARLLFVG